MESESLSGNTPQRLDPYIKNVMEYLENLNARCPGFLVPFLLEVSNPSTRDFRYGFEDRIFCANFSVTQTNEDIKNEIHTYRFYKDYLRLVEAGGNRMRAFASRLTDITQSNLTAERKLDSQTDMLLQLLEQLKQHPYWQNIMRDISILPNEKQIEFTSKLLISVAYSLVTMQYSANFKKYNEVKKEINELQDRKDQINERITSIKTAIESQPNQKLTSEQKREIKALEKELKNIEKQLSPKKAMLDDEFKIAHEKSGFNTIYNKLKANPEFETLLKQKLTARMTEQLTQMQTATPPSRRDLARSHSSEQISTTAQLMRDTPIANPTRVTKDKKSDAQRHLIPGIQPSSPEQTTRQARSIAVTELPKDIETKIKEVTGKKGAESQESQEESEEESEEQKHESKRPSSN